MQKVGHDLLCQRAIFRQERLIDVELEHTLVVGELADQLVNAVVDLPQLVVCRRAALVVISFVLHNGAS